MTTDKGAKAPSTLPEKLTREIARVTELRSLYESMRGKPQIIVEPAIFMMNQSLEAAMKAAGTGDIGEMIAAVQDLEGFEK